MRTNFAALLPIFAVLLMSACQVDYEKRFNKADVWLSRKKF
ncbi:MAG: hypothetical protein PHS14_02995 [Elusimicrobia bacterium]|nr:hypothetical protein [Elusimicrobiota bacterium]